MKSSAEISRTHIARELAAQYGREAVQIIESGQYVSTSGKTVQISGLIKKAVEGTESYPPERELAQSARGEFATIIRVLNETTLGAARSLLNEGYRPVALNFASATEPGGGFLRGARAQEEYLARSSGLYACLEDKAMYEFHYSQRDPLYSDYVIYSPDVPVFRAEDGTLMDEPYTVGIITSPAVYAYGMPSDRRAEIGPAMWKRILKVLAVGRRHGHDAMVLGAWGCGAFGNDGSQIAELFRKALTENFRGAYRQVIFAIVDWSTERKFIGPFENAFQSVSTGERRLGT